MRTFSHGLALSAAVVVGLGARAFTAADSGRSVAVLIDDRAGVWPGDLDQAAKEASRIYRQAGVKLVWLVVPESAGDALPEDLLKPENSVMIRLIIQPRFQGTLVAATQSFLLGATVLIADECGGVVYLFFDQVIELAAAQRVAPPLVLGTAAAHEIGHVLLRGRGHATEGLMRAPWKADDWQRAAAGLLLFSPRERDAIRRRIAACR
jgi:hypothetical protein